MLLRFATNACRPVALVTPYREGRTGRLPRVPAWEVRLDSGRSSSLRGVRLLVRKAANNLHRESDAMGHEGK